MQINKVQNNNPAFGLGITPHWYKRASHYYQEMIHDQQLFSRFYRKAKFMEQNFGHDDYRLTLGKKYKKNTRYYVLGLLKHGDSEERTIELNSERYFRDLIECFVQLKQNYVDRKINYAELRRKQLL